MALISAIITNYNHAKFLKRRIESIIKQTFLDFEIIILDDASTDNSKEIIEDYRSHPQIKSIIYNKANSGSPFKQWARGIDIAATEWIWIAESDDYCEREFLESLLPAFNNAAVLAYAEINWVDAAGEIIKKAEENAPALYEGKAFLLEKMLFKDHLVNAGMAIFRRSACLGIDPYWTTMQQAGDYWFFTEIAAQGKVYACGKPLCFFTRHQNASSNRFHDTDTQRLENLAVLDQMFRRGSINKAQFKDYFLQQLVALQTQKNSHQAFKEYYDFWLQQAAIRNIKPAKMEIAIPAFTRKLKHYIKKKD